MMEGLDSRYIYKILARALKKEEVHYIFTIFTLECNGEKDFLEKGVKLINCSSSCNVTFVTYAYARFYRIGSLVLDGGSDSTLSSSFEHNVPVICLLMGDQEEAVRPLFDKSAYFEVISVFFLCQTF